MTFSIQQLYRNHVLLLCAVFTLLLTAGLSTVSMVEGKRTATRELQTQANMMADMLLAQPETSNMALKHTLEHSTVNPTLSLACILGTNGAVRVAVQGNAYDRTAGSPISCEPKSLKALTGGYVVARTPLSSEILPTATGEVVLIALAPSPLRYILRWLVIAIFLSLLLVHYVGCWACASSARYSNPFSKLPARRNG